MEVQTFASIVIDGTTRSLLDEVTSLAGELNKYRPFSPEVGERLRRALLPDRIVASLNMEGIAATRRQTLAVMDALRINEGINKGELEIANILEADEYVTNAVHDDLPLTASIVRDVNGLVMKALMANAGSYRTTDIELPGAPWPPPSPFEVSALTADLVEEFSRGNEQHPIVQAAWLHAQFTRIHPFSDGNGRTGRLLQDFVLMRRGLMPVGISPDQRDDYYAALGNADDGTWSPLVELLALLALRTTQQALSLAKEPESRANWIQALSKAAAAKSQDTRHKQFLVWRTRMEFITQAFKTAAEELDEQSGVIGAELRDLGVLDFEQWKTVCQKGWTERSWSFSMLFYAEGRPFYRLVAFLRRHRARPEADHFVDAPDLVTLYVTGNEAHSQERPDFNNYNDPHIRLRELAYVDGALQLYTASPHGDGWTRTADKTIDQVVEMLFMDVFGRKAGLGAG